MNVPAVLGVIRALRKPEICVPHCVVDTFGDIPVPLERAFKQHQTTPPDIRAIVLDKDNCIAIPDQNVVHSTCKERLGDMINAFSRSQILIVSNSSGLNAKDHDGSKAADLERATGLPVLRHAQPKPACGPEILSHFGRTVTDPRQVVVIGDRLFTDVALASSMGSRSIWVRRGVVPDSGPVTRLEHWLLSFLQRRGVEAPNEWKSP
ncbi:MAG: hypothetical protein Q9162_000849 [Coniocarpon cinnabarinum]